MSQSDSQGPWARTQAEGSAKPAVANAQHLEHARPPLRSFHSGSTPGIQSMAPGSALNASGGLVRLPATVHVTFIAERMT